VAIVLEIPEDCKQFAQAVKEMVAVVGRARAGATGGKRLDYEAVELALQEGAAAIERGGHSVVLAALDIYQPAIEVAGERHSRVGRYAATYYSLAGPVVVERSLYRRDGERNGKTVDAISLRVGVVGDGWLPRTARAMAHQVQSGTSREAEKNLREAGRLPYSRTSFEEVTHLVGELYVRRHVDIEDALIAEQAVPAEVRSLSVSLDRGSLPMEEPRKRPQGRPRKGAPKRPVSRVYRMAYAGTVTLCDKDGNAVQTIRYGAMPAGDPVQLCAGMAGDVVALLSKRPSLEVMLLCDGAPEMWNLLENALPEQDIGKTPYQLVDLWHLVEKLGRAASLLAEPGTTSQLVEKWKLALLNHEQAAGAILDELVSSGKEWVRVGDDQPVHDAITYLQNHAKRMDYATARRQGLPIGSGNVEATCKSLFEVRMKRPGSRWKEATGEHLVHLRALALSDRWPAAMQLTLAPLRCSVRAAA
jgi:hypothetical protein